MVKILTEASGSLTSAYIIEAIRAAGFSPVASDVDPESVGRYLADGFIQMPFKTDSQLWEKVNKLLVSQEIKVVIPSFDEMLLGWAERKNQFNKDQNIAVLLSDKETVGVFQDKWLTYEFFSRKGIPTPETSLEQKYPLIKPRFGRGSVGVIVTSEKYPMEGNISQELLKGEEYTVDVFCDNSSNPVYIVPRIRLGVRDGKSTGGMVVQNQAIEEWVKKICREIAFIGPVNMQCFVCEDGSVKFIEINPRIAGGMALGFAATENWIKLAVDHFVYGKKIDPVPIKYGLKMRRYYAEVFIP